MGIIDNAIGGVKSLIVENPILAVGGATAVGAATGIGVYTAAKAIGNNGNNRKKTGRRIKHTKRGWKADRKRRSKQKWEVAYQKRKRRSRKHMKSSRSRRGIHYTKNGQPYKILSNGRARFVKRKGRK